MTAKQKTDWAKWLVAIAAGLSILTPMVAWAVSVDSAAGRVLTMEQKIDRIEQFLYRLAAKNGMRYTEDK